MTPDKPGTYWYRSDGEHPWETVDIIGAGITGYGSCLFVLTKDRHGMPAPLERITGEFVYGGELGSLRVGMMASDGYVMGTH